MLALQWLGGREVVARRAQVTDNRIDNPRASASVRGEEEDNRSNDDAKNAKEGINPSVEWRGVGIGFGWHGI